MYLDQLKTRIKSQTDFAPQSGQGYDQFLTSIINDAYHGIWYQRPWTFNTRTAELEVYPDLSAQQLLLLLTGTNDLTTLPLQIANGTKVLFIGNTPGTPETYLTLKQDMFDQMLGAWIELDGRDYQIVDIRTNQDGGDYGVYLFLDRVFYSNVPFLETATFETATVKFKTYKLPEDVSEILDVTFTNNRDVGGLRRGQVLPVNEKLANDYDLSYQQTGAKPMCFVPITAQSFITDGDDFFTVTENTGGTTHFEANTTYYFAWERVDLCTGSTLGMSNPITYKPSSASVQSITFTAGRTLPLGQARRLIWGLKRPGTSDISWNYGWLPYGTIIPWNNFTPTIPNFWIADEDSTTPETKTLTATGVITLMSSNSYLNNGMRHPLTISKYQGATQRKAIRLYPRPQTVDFERRDPDGVSAGEPGPWYNIQSIATVRYVAKIPPLQEAYDTPMIPAEFHYLIVQKARVELYMRQDQLSHAAMAQRLYDEGMKSLISRYGNERSVVIQRSQQGLTSGYWNNYLNTITYTPR